MRMVCWLANIDSAGCRAHANTRTTQPGRDAVSVHYKQTGGALARSSRAWRQIRELHLLEGLQLMAWKAMKHRDMSIAFRCAKFSHLQGNRAFLRKRGRTLGKSNAPAELNFIHGKAITPRMGHFQQPRRTLMLDPQPCDRRDRGSECGYLSGRHWQAVPDADAGAPGVGNHTKPGARRTSPGTGLRGRT